MRVAPCLAAAALATATPALATGTILCRSTVSPGNGPSLALVVGHGEAIGVVQARVTGLGPPFTTGEGVGAPAIGQAWLDRDMLRLDIVDANAERRILRLDTRRRGGAAYLGNLYHGGRTWQMRCSEEG
jgi:hypothetical protein